MYRSSKKKYSLASLINRPSGLLAPGAYDMISARIIERLGFESVYFTGYGNAASHLGMPDVGLITMTEMVDRIHNLVNCVSLPIIADADTGFGNPIGVLRTVKEYEQAGASAIQIEDQVAPKKCGHTSVSQIVPPKEMIHKIEAARDARSSKEFLIIARTDSRAVHGLEDAIQRGKLYHKAGADLIFVEAPRSLAELERIGNQINAPLVANMVEGGKTPVLPFEQLVSMGYKLVIYPGTAHKAATYGVRKALDILKRNEISLLDENLMVTSDEMHDLVGFNEVFDLEKKYKI